MHSALVMSPVLVFIPLFAFVLPVLFRLMKRCQISDLTPEWVESFNVSYYRPMQGLLAAEDFRFLAEQPGFDPSLYRKLRRERLLIFRQYLNRLILDFNRVHMLARLVIAENPVDQSALLGKLLLLRFQFGIAVAKVEVKYFTCRFGIRPVAVDALIQQLEFLTNQLGPSPELKANW